VWFVVGGFIVVCVMFVDERANTVRPYMGGQTNN
jgi:hypothetical protein